MNHIPFKNYTRANELLYILSASKGDGLESISKIGLQKVIYLANLLAPVKEIILATIKFLSYTRGPYSRDIQNTLDQLTANGYVYIVSFKEFNQKSSIATYAITKAGEKVVSNLSQYPKEEEKKWWFKTIVQLSNLYSSEPIFRIHGSYSGFDKIVNLVYQDETYLDIKINYRKGFKIDLVDTNKPTYSLIKFIKEYVETNGIMLNSENERRNTELILLGFFEFLYSKYIDSLINE